MDRSGVSSAINELGDGLVDALKKLGIELRKLTNTFEKSCMREVGRRCEDNGIEFFCSTLETDNKAVVFREKYEVKESLHPK